MSQTGLRLEAGRAPLQGTGRKTSVVLDHRERLYTSRGEKEERG